MKTIQSHLSIIILIFSAGFLFAQNPNRLYQSHSENEGVLELKVNDGTYQIKLYNEDIVETTFIPTAETTKTESHAVVLKPSKSNITLNDVDGIITFASEGITVKIQKQPFQIQYYYNSKFLTSERQGYYKSEHQPMDLVKGNIVADQTEKIEFNLSPDEVLYGGGARALGMNRRGYRLPLYNRAHYGYETHSELMNYTLPIVVSSKKYMIHFDNAPIGYLDLDSKGDNTLTYETISGRKTYQIITGDSWPNIMDAYTDLTGKQPLPPRWALGNFSSRFGYHSQEETEATIEKFLQDEIPVDAIILDLYWFGKDIQGTMGNLDVFRDSFPDFEGMIKRLKAKGVKTIPITEPFILTTSNRWQEAVEADILAKDSIGNPATYDFYFGNTGIIDVYKKEGEQWFWNIYKDLADKGAAGIWGDLGEPEVHPSWVRHHNKTADEVHNTYGHDWARLIYEGYAREFPETRPFILMRAGYSGSQRYAMMPWSGDVNRTWGGMQSQMEIALQMGMQGLGYMHSDLGGFAGANRDDELYIRWLQYGVFQPIYRPHAQEEVASEPVFRSGFAKRIAKQAIELRYQLLPYNYTLAFENSTTGMPLMRPLFFEDDTPDLKTKVDTYLWGNDFLITPVVNPGVKEQEVYFPKNTIWFDFYSDERVEGGQSKSVLVIFESIPTFVRAGAFIPMAKLVQSTDDYTLDEFDLHYYHDPGVKHSYGSIYNDDGSTKNAFEKGAYECLEFLSRFKNNTLNIEVSVQVGDTYQPKEKTVSLLIHNSQTKPKYVKVNNKKVDFNWDRSSKTVQIPFKIESSNQIITVKF